ncbi:hypothetical protein [Hyphomonas johnsonii]|uniref:Uncharacterized protein n=1 Tax=Hyphomonas johnsonii MHS-2 TaxID=1280950 RepID=A0A059FU12_9PROT|nr:hypothetical protein [Hyphomonas johnsonii]KCZ94072.1 hypothetical protein HJO_01815 [Hyphomonas johnsonii MHS-2]
MYAFYVHRRAPTYRLVIHADAPFPAESPASDWTLTRTRTPEDTNPDVRAAIDETGYCLFRIGLRFDEINLL